MVAQAESGAGHPVTRAAHHSPGACPQRAVLNGASKSCQRDHFWVGFGFFFFFTLQHWMQSQDELNELTQPADVFISTPLINGDVGSPGLLQVAVSVVAAAGAPGLGSCSR